MNLGKSCSEITEQNCSPDLTSLCYHIENSIITESLGLPYRNVSGIAFGNFGGEITKPKLFWN